MRSLTQEEVSQQLGISPQAYSKMENGETRIDVDRLFQLAAIFGMEARDLLDMRDSSPEADTASECSKHSNAHTIHCSLAIELRVVVQQQKEEILFLREQLKTMQEMLKKFV